MKNAAQTAICDFRDGKKFTAGQPLDAFFDGKEISPLTISTLKKELTVGSEHVRENIVTLLSELGTAADTADSDKIPVIRNRLVLDALINEGFAKNDKASEMAERVLRRRVMPADLSKFGAVFVRSLSQQKTNYLLLAAKAKAWEARRHVDNIATQKWSQENLDHLIMVRIAQAALGNTSVEDDFISAARRAEETAPPAPESDYYNLINEKDGSELANQLHWLGLIGTKRSLLVACEYLRSPLKSYVQDTSEKSIRYNALAAIAYNYPDERVLYSPRKHEDWNAAEQFCSKVLGARFDGPTPRLPQDRIYPTHQHLE